MKKQIEYDKELKNIRRAIKKNFKEKYNFKSELKTLYYIRKITKLNRQTRNEHVDELMCILGKTKLQYKKHCNRNNYYSDPYINKKIKEAYIKLSKKAMKIKTKRANVKEHGIDLKIEYNSDRGNYKLSRLKNDEVESYRYYRIKGIKAYDKKRKKVLDEFKKMNYGINVFDELGVNEGESYKLNPDIIYILLNEGNIDYAKMYIKNVLDENTITYKPFVVKYELNRNLSKGVFSQQENKAMKKMAMYDRNATKLVIFDERKKKEVLKPVANILQKLKKYMNFGENIQSNEPTFNEIRNQKIEDFKQRLVIPSSVTKNASYRRATENIVRTNSYEKDAI